MVLGFGRRTKKKEEEPVLKVSPSLPNIGEQGVAWGNLVDPAALQDLQPQHAHGHSGTPAKLSFQTLRGSIPFHKPFRGGEGAVVDGDGSIASLYAKPAPQSAVSAVSGPPSSFKRGVGTQSMYGRGQRRPKIAQTFNLMVAGGQGTGKTSFLRLLLDTCDLSPNATVDQRTTVDRFIKNAARPTSALHTACIEICETKFDRVLLTVIDTPGLDYGPGAELGLERSVSGIVKYLDLQFAETMGEEAKVVRQNKGDQHIHLCIYLIDPESVITANARKARLQLPILNRSTHSLRYRGADAGAESSGESSDTDDEDDATPRHRLTMNPAEIRVIKRLSTRVNVLPVVARADALTDENLAGIKRAVRRDLAAAGVTFGVFDSLDPSLSSTPKTHRRPRGQANTDPGVTTVEEYDDDEPAPQVIQIKKPRFNTLTRSRSKRNLQELDEDLFGESRQPFVADPVDGRPMEVRDAPAFNVLPFSIIAPEQQREKRTKKKKKHSKKHANANGNGTAAEIENGHGEHAAEDEDEDGVATPRTKDERRRSTGALSTTSTTGPVSPSENGHGSTGLPYMMSPLHQAMRGRFVRRFRWGTVDVLDPAHCDFAALRTAVLNTHMKALKASTRDVLYEQFRTEKLLARRATQNINDEDRKRLLEDLGI